MFRGGVAGRLEVVLLVVMGTLLGTFSVLAAWSIIEGGAGWQRAAVVAPAEPPGVCAADAVPFGGARIL